MQIHEALSALPHAASRNSSVSQWQISGLQGSIQLS